MIRILSSLFTAILFFSFAAIGQITFSPRPGPNGASVGDIEINSSSHIFIYEGTPGSSQKPIAGSVYRSTNNGTDWVKLSTGTNGLNDNDTYDILIDASNNIYVLGKTKIYKSTAASNGDLWTSFTPPAPFVGGSELAKTADGELYLVNSFSGVFRSLDDGATWTNISNNLPSPTNYTTIIAVTNDVYVGVLNDGTYRLLNNSGVWSAFNTGITLPDQPASFALKGTTLYQTDRDGVHYYNGTTWVQIASQFGAGNLSLPESFNSSDHGIVSGAGNKLYVFFSGKFDGQGKIYSSNNATAGPWTLITTTQLNESIWALKAFTGGTSVFAGYNKNGIFRSTNDGTTWAFSNNGLTISPGKSVVRANTSNEYFIADGSSYLHRSSNGFSWTRSQLNSCTTCFFSTIIKLTNGNLLAIGNETYRSLDNGSTWTDIGGPTAPVFLENVVTGTETKYYGYRLSGGVTTYYASSSATPAATWSLLTLTGLPGSYRVEKMAADASSNLYIYLSNFSNNTKELYKVINGATAANKITNTLFNNDIRGIQGLAGAINVLGFNSSASKYQIARTTDGGTSWTRTDVRSLDDFFIVQTGLITGREVSGNSSNFYFSNDGGTTWTLAFAEQKDTYLIGANVDANGYLDIVINGAPIYSSQAPIFKPVSPSNLQSIGSGSNMVVLEWDHNGLYLQDFEITRRLQGGTTFSVLEPSVGGSYRYYEDNTVAPSTTYEYQVTAKSAAGNSTSSILSVTSGATCTLTIPDNRSWTGTVPGGFTNATIAIQKQFDSYSITDFTAGSLNTPIGQTIIAGEFYENCGAPFIRPTGNVYPNGGGIWNPTTKTLTLNFQVDKNQYTPTEKTITLVLNTNDPAPAKPLNVSALVLDNTSSEIKWTPGLYQKDYVIERAIGAGAYSSIGTVNYPVTSFKDNGPLAIGTTYSYRIRTRNNNTVPLENLSDPATLIFRKPNFIIPNTVISNFNASTISSQWADFNNDGLQDYITLNLNTTAQKFQVVIFKNLGTGDFQQIDPVLEDKAYGFPSIADYNNDGFTDIGFAIDEIVGFDLYKGNGDFTFTIASASEIGDLASSTFSNNSSSWADINNDGLLDLFQWAGTQKRLFKQNVNHSFSLITGGSLATDVTKTSIGLWADYNNDGFQDLLLTNGETSGQLRLYRNNGNETFTLTTGTGFDAIEATFAAWGDYNNDGNTDLFTSNKGGYALYKNNGNNTFTKDVTTIISTQLQNSNAGMASWGDYNNDGYLDLLTTGFGIPTTLYMRIPGASVAFTKISDEKVIDPYTFHYGLAQADYNEDGFLDLAFSSFEFSEIGDTFLPSSSNLFKNNNTSGNWLLVKLSGIGSNKDAIGAKIIVTTSGGSFYREISSLSSFVSRNATTTHIGLGNVASVISIQVRWPSGLVQTLVSPTINQIIQIAEDGAAPQVVTLNPANNATIVAVDTKVEITFNEPPVAVAGKKITITPNGGTAIILDVSAGVVAGNKVTFTLPAALAAFTQHNVTLDAGAFVDGYSNATTAITSGWTFQTIDTTPPVILFATPTTAPTAVDKGFSSNKLSFTITDNSGTVSSATLSYRKIAGGSFTDLAGIFNAASGKWDFTVLETFFDATGLEYFITAKDPSNTAGRLPLDANTNFYLYLNYKGTDNIFPSDKIGFGGQKTNWKIMSIPFELGANNGVLTVFDEVTKTDPPLENKIDWRILTYKDASAWGEFPEDFSTFTRGKGYFINIKKAIGTINLPEATAPTNTRKNLFQMTLKKGWNQIGNPYLTSISWDDVKTFNSLAGTAAQLKQFESGAYANNNLLAPFAGGFVFVDNDVTVSIPFAGQTSTGGRKQEGIIADRDNWMLPITLTQDALKNDFSGVGMQAAAQLSFDQFDDINPPRFFDFAELNFDHPEHFAKRFARDIVPVLSEYTWEFTINSNQTGLAELSWGSTKGGDNRSQLFLLDVAQQTPIDMKQNHSYSFDPKSSTRFAIYYGENLESKLKPNRVTLGQAVPNPTSGSTSISFSLPEYSGKYQVSLEIFDMLGRKIATVAEGEYASGFYKKQWNETEGLSDGLYTYRLTVAAGKKREVLGARMILKR